MKDRNRRHHRAWRALIALAATVACLLALGSGSAMAAFGLATFDGEITADEGGAVATQAGSHPFAITTELELNTFPGEFGVSMPDGAMKDLVAELPAGLVGNANSVPKCTLAELYNGGGYNGEPTCPDNTAVGVIKLIFFGGEEIAYQPIFNLVPAPGEPARFGFYLVVTPTYMTTSVRSGDDYGINLMVDNTAEALALTGSEVTFWGNPADPVHDGERGSCMQQFGPSGKECPFTVPPNNAQKTSFLTLPSSCSGPLQFTARASNWLDKSNWSDPSQWASASFETHDSGNTPVGIEGCEELAFNPRLQGQLSEGKADSPSGIDFSLQIPQSESVDGLATSLMKKSVVTLPQGVTLNSSAAAGLGACSPAQIGLQNGNPAQCPDSAKIGEVEIATPLLEEPLKGAMYIAEQNNNPFGSLFAGYMVAEGSGVVIKQAAKFDLDPQTGQVTATFDDIPQQPFSDLQIHLFGGPRAVLKTPSACGSYAIQYEMTPYSGTAPVTGTSSLEVNQGCDTGGFAPKLSAGSTNPVAGAFAPFVFDLTREDGEQNIGEIALTLPQGQTAKLAGVPLCPDAAAASGNCPAASQVGEVDVAAGAGPSPVWVPQAGKAPTAVYLAGAYKGAPYSIVAKVPAQAGPFDLGTVAVRSAISIDPTTAQVSVNSDPLPQILQGVPVAYRHIHIAVNRPGFMLNPTSCDPMQVSSAIRSATGTEVKPSSRFQVGSCGDLGFAPKLVTQLKGKANRGAHPSLRAVLTMPADGANMRRATVTLPRSEFLDQAHIRTVCTRVQFAADQCPAGSVYGTARAFTPLLDQPLEGPVYLRSNGGERELPDLVAALDGAIDIDVVGYIDSVNGGIRTRFVSVPDAPVSKFVLNMQGGSRGLLQNSTNICKGVHRVNAKFVGHNGRVSQSSPALKSKAC